MLPKTLLYFLLVLMTHTLNAQTISVDNWTKYCGWHYANTPPIWAGWSREYAKDKFGLYISDSITYQMDTVVLQNSYNLLANADSTIDLLQLVGGLTSARDTLKVINFMDMIEADNGAKWKKIVFTQSKKLTQLPDSENRVFWQIGNEISSPAYSRTIRYWQGQPYFNGYDFDYFTITYYVENYLAPTAEAIDSASLEVYGQKGKIKMCLGSITNAQNPAAQSFLNSLLNYEIVGTNAPTLAGKKVSDLIHLITIHYAMGTASTSDWLANITAYKNWTGTGRIEGVWSTEEVGINQASIGNGAFAGSIVTSRYLEWATTNQYTSKEVRTNYFGWNTGNPISTVNTFNTFLFNHLGNSKISNVNAVSTTINSLNSIEKHSIKNELGNKGIVFVFPERIQGQSNTAVINNITLNHLGWGNIQGISTYRYNSSGIDSIGSTINQIGMTTTLSFDSALLLNNTDGLLVLINTEDILSNRHINPTPSEFSVYPNPTEGNLTIKVLDVHNFSGQIQLFNAVGQLVKEIQLPQSNQIGISELTDGIYFIRHKNSPYQTLKIIKQIE